jgi:hypothetical protein
MHMAISVHSATAKVRDPEEVRTILASFKVRGVEIQLNNESAQWPELEDWSLELTFKDEHPNAMGGPKALPADQWPKEDDGQEDQWGQTELDRRFEQKGDDGFEELLLKLAPHLAAPLLILSVTRHGPDCDAHAWRVEPGCKEVETLGASLM